MAVFWRLLLGHCLADFTFQPEYLNIWKRSTMLGMFVHCLIHPLMYAVLAYPFLGDNWIETRWLDLTGWQCVYILFLLHLVEDASRVLAIRKYRGLDNSWCFAWDQAFHVATIFLIAPFGMLGAAESGVMPEAWPVLGCLLVLVTHAGTVLIYFLEKDLDGADFPASWEKWMGMGERLVLFLLCALPGGGWVLLAAGWLWLMYRARTRKMVDSSYFNLVVGAALSLACGLAGRWLLNS
ncbi:MAG: DUF3307 domain-containing protein [Elusimicrobia bacterium]|nr:DUF3307 domain-containing protein [Elusimicrobiota bacterium]